jgi:hypothetical protein
MYKFGEPCDHTGCASHITHPCEGCGRIAARRRPVRSSNVASIGYDAVNKVLEVEFHNGNRVYQYFDVPEEVAKGAISGPSVGHALHVIKGTYRCQAVER